MQDIHSIGSGGGGGGRLFAATTAGDRRLRPNHHHQGHTPPALKCPRCESLNTKFCYYNNYNLSQPRHFCKSCRRYWTKGGVLRNVPVGGGCRKTKRSKSKSSNNSNRSSKVRKSSNSQNSSSDSSSLTATTTAANTSSAAGIGTVPVPAATVSAAVEVFKESCSSGAGFLNQNPNFNNIQIDHSSTENNSNMFSEIGTFTSLITSSTSQLPLGFDVSPFTMHNNESSNENQQHQWMHTDQETGGGIGFMNDPTAQTTDGGLGTDDWNNGTDHALFDLTGTVDDQSYWSQTQWDDDDNNHDHHLSYLP